MDDLSKGLTQLNEVRPNLMLNCKEISQNYLPIHPLSESKTLISILQVYSVAAKRNVPTEGKQTHFNALIKEIAHT